MKERTMSALERTIVRHPRLEGCRASIKTAYETLLAAFAAGAKLLLCGNGGSAADATHIAGELAKAYLLRRAPREQIAEKIRAGLPGPDASCLLALEEALPAISLTTNSALLTATANDVSAELVFAQQVMAYGRAGDVVLGLTTSGSSANVVRAFQTARVLGLSSICLTGSRAPEWLRDLVDVVIAVPESSTPSVQELHLPVYHALCEMLESELFVD
ncbi:MAG: SIS domain-containing protein [Spirochaetaceae bacterium]|nr:MAG: SIS domain-containing protein [Spirochaetaceae bacterium]